MNLSKLVFACLVYLSTFAAQAQQIIGNGGDGLVCLGQSARLLDLYEATDRYELTLRDFGDLTSSQIIEDVLERWQVFDPTRVARFRQDLTQIYQADAWNEEVTHLVEGVVLEDIPDDQGYLYVPAGCDVLQVAIQSLAPVIPGQKRFTISEDVWEAFDPTHRAALVVHELLYAEAIRHQVSQSWRIRYLIGHLFSEDLDDTTDEDYEEILQVADLLRLGETYAGLRFVWNSTSFYDSGEPESGGALREPNEESLGGFRYVTVPGKGWSAQLDEGERVVLKKNGNIDMLIYRQIKFYAEGCVGDSAHDGVLWTYDDGVIRGIETVDGGSLTPCLPNGHGAVHIEPASPVRFSPSGFPRSWTDASSSKLPVFGKAVYFREEIELHDTGFVKSGTLSGSGSLMTAGDYEVDFIPGTYLTFNEEGKVDFDAMR